MRFGPPDEVLSGSCGWSCVVTSWRGPIAFPYRVPVLRGRYVAKTTRDILESVTLTVPRWAPGGPGQTPMDWRAGSDPRHPLASYGQELQISVVVTSAVTGQEWETRIGRVLITDWDDDDQGRITVTGEGRLRRVLDDRLVTPLQPRSNGTLVTEARRLLPAGMSAAFAAGLVDRVCPPGMAWSDDRLAALREIADAWPARLRTDEWGQVQFRPPLPDIPAPVLTLTDGKRGTLVRAPRADTRAGRYNRVVASSSAPGAEDIQAIADQKTGPMAVSGDYGVVTRRWSSPLITTQAQAAASAATMVRSSVLPAQTLPVECAPDPRVDLDDAVSVVRDGVKTWGWVTGYDLPLTVADGPMRIDVGVAA